MNIKVLCTKWESTAQERLEETQCWYRLAQQLEYLHEKAHSNSLSVYAYFLKPVWMLNESNITCVDWPLVFFAFLASFFNKILYFGVYNSFTQKEIPACLFMWRSMSHRV